MRFWQWVGEKNGWVRFNVKPGQEVSWETGGRHEEGWSSEYMRFIGEDDGSVRVESGSDGVDSDGWMSTYRDWVMVPGGPLRPVFDYYSADDRDLLPCSDGYICSVVGQMEHPVTGAPCFTPVGEDVGSGQRDYSAEAMGY